MKFTEDRRAMLSTCFMFARIDTPVEIGQSTQIWDVHVMQGAKIGDGCTIGDGVHIGRDVVIGNRCKIQNGAQLFTGVTLEDDVFVGPCVVFTNVLTPRAFIDRKQEFRPTLVKRGASIGANATILCGVTIEEYAMVGAGAMVGHSVAPHRIVVGNLAREVGWACECGARIEPMPMSTFFSPCSACKKVYELYDGRPVLR